MKTIISPDIRILQQNFLKRTIKYTDPNKQIPNYKSSFTQILDLEQTNEAIELVRHEFTHLDAHLLQD